MNDLLRFPSAVRRDPRIEAWFSDFADPLRLMTRTWFERMRGCGADARELLHDGCPVACVGDAPFGSSTRSRLMLMSASTMAHACGSRRPARRRGQAYASCEAAPGKELDAEALSDLIVAAYHDIWRRLRGRTHHEESDNN